MEAQKTLTNFSVVEITKGNNKISWHNPYKTCIQLSVQRSTDSINNFRTILSAHSPELAENGFIDKKAPENSNVYYRIFYTLKGGDYYFSKVVEVSKSNKEVKISSKKKKNNRSKKHSKEIKSSAYFFIGANGNIHINLPKAKQLFEVQFLSCLWCNISHLSIFDGYAPGKERSKRFELQTGGGIRKIGPTTAASSGSQ